MSCLRPSSCRRQKPNSDCHPSTHHFTGFCRGFGRTAGLPRGVTGAASDRVATSWGSVSAPVRAGSMSVAMRDDLGGRPRRRGLSNVPACGAGSGGWRSSALCAADSCIRASAARTASSASSRASTACPSLVCRSRIVACAACNACSACSRAARSSRSKASTAASRLSPGRSGMVTGPAARSRCSRCRGSTTTGTSPSRTKR